MLRRRREFLLWWDGRTAQKKLGLIARAQVPLDPEDASTIQGLAEAGADVTDADWEREIAFAQDVVALGRELVAYAELMRSAADAEAVPGRDDRRVLRVVRVKRRVLTDGSSRVRGIARVVLSADRTGYLMARQR